MMVRCSVFGLLSVVGVLLVPLTASANTWKSTGKVDPGAAKAAIQAMNSGLSSGSLTRSKDKENTFSTSGKSKMTGNNLSGEWNVDLLLGNVRKKQPRTVSIGFDPKASSISVDYQTGSFDVLFPVLWGLCGPKVGMSAATGGSQKTVKGKSIPAFYVAAECSGQVGCGIVAPRCKVTFIGGGLSGRGEAGVKACSSGSCVYSYVSGSFGPTFEVKAACDRLTLFSWRDRWVQAEKTLKVVNY